MKAYTLFITKVVTLMNSGTEFVQSDIEDMIKLEKKLASVINFSLKIVIVKKNY